MKKAISCLVLLVIAAAVWGQEGTGRRQCGSPEEPLSVKELTMTEGDVNQILLRVGDSDGLDPNNGEVGLVILSELPSFAEANDLKYIDPNYLLGTTNNCDGHFVDDVNYTVALGQLITLKPGFLDAGVYHISYYGHDGATDYHGQYIVTVKNLNRSPFVDAVCLGSN